MNQDRLNTDLLDATKKNNLPKVQSLLSAGADANASSASGSVPLMFAAHNGNEGIISLLLMLGADINHTNKDGVTPLLYAVHANHADAVEFLLDAGAKPNIANKKGVTPLALAAQEGYERIVKLLIAADANVNTGNITGDTPLLLASQNGHTEIARSLLAAGADINRVNEEGTAPIVVAAERGHADIIALLMPSRAASAGRKGPPSTPFLSAALMAASLNGHSDVVRLLLNAGADINVQLPEVQQTVLDHAAVGSFHPAINELILQHANANSGPSRSPPLPLPPVFDFSLYDEVPFATAHKDPGNVVFRIGGSLFSYLLSQLRESIFDKTGITYACKREGWGAPFISDVYAESPYFILRGIGVYMIPLVQIQYVLKHASSRFFELVDTGVIKEFTAGYGSVQHRPGADQRGWDIDISSADHCQRGTGRAVYHLKEMHLPGVSQSGGGGHNRKRGGRCHPPKTRKRR